MRVLVTGAAGFVGSTAVDRMLELGWTVVGLDNFDPYYAREIKEQNLASARGQGGFSLVEADLLDRSAILQTVSDGPFDAVLHLAALAGVHPSLARPLDYQRVNIEGSMVLLEACRQVGVPRVVLGSSSSVYGVRSEIPFCESDPCDRPASPYAATKRAMELMAFNFHHLSGTPVRCLRFFTVYGPRQRPDMAIAKFAQRIQNREQITLYGDGQSARDYTYVDDIVSGTLAAVERCAEGYRIYNIGGTGTTTLERLVSLLEGALGIEARVEHIADQPGDVPITCADVRRATEELGFEPAVGIEEGIGRYVAWLRRASP